ncbi:MAG: pirin family protein [Anaerolineae bacterium]
MGTNRTIASVSASQATVEGAGVHLRRAFGFRRQPNLDPFLLLDEFHSANPEDYRAGFPWHPHRGIETITYVMRGRVTHQDSLGNKGVIGPGDVQWMTAGSGIIHQEMPEGDAEGVLWGLQLWANLPAAHKMMDPRYQEVKAAEVPVIERADGTVIRLVCGELDGQRGPVQDIMANPSFMDVSLPAEAVFSYELPEEHNIFGYVFEGEVFGDDSPRQAVGAQHLVTYNPGSVLRLRAEKAGAHLLLAAGKPLKEPVAWYGPIVMNTQEELETAFREYENGTFLKHKRS